MYKKILEKIEEYSTIILYRHIRPDYDAFGSQFGMYDLIKFTYPEKNVLFAGEFDSDLVKLYDYETDPDDFTYGDEDKLGIVMDTANVDRVDGDIGICKEIIKIDHHIVVDSFGDINIENPKASSCSEMIVDIYEHLKENLFLSEGGANALFLGIVGDTGRFLFSNCSAHTFKAAAILLEQGIDIAKLYLKMNLHQEKDLKVQGHILTHYQSFQNIAYYILKDTDLKMLDISRSRGSDFVNLLQDVDKYPVWMAITEDVTTHSYRVSIRSREIDIHEVAMKYHGGGHANASGCTLQSLDDLPNILNDLQEVIYG